MKKRILSALLLSCALVIAPLGNLFSTVATASDNSGRTALGVYGNINLYFPSVNGYIGWRGEYVAPWMTVTEALQKIHERYTAEQLQEYMQIEPAIGDQLRQFEMMMEDAGVTVSAASEVEQIASVQVSGAALNADSENTAVALKVAAPAQSVDLGGVANVQADIDLTGVADSHNLKYPVTVTLSVPTGLTAGNMHIRHYVNGVGAEAEIVPFTVNGDGTITFSVSSLSLFAFVEGQASDQNPAPAPDNGNNNDNNDKNDNNDDSSDNNDSGESTPAGQGVKDSVPKTDDSTIPVLPFAAAGAVCAAVAFTMKKKEQ